MKVNLSGHHVKITESINEYVEEKLTKVGRKFPSLINGTVILKSEHNEHSAEVSVNYEGVMVSAKGDNKVLYPAIDSAVKKLESALAHRKGALKANKHDKPSVTTDPIAHEIVQGMNL